MKVKLGKQVDGSYVGSTAYPKGTEVDIRFSNHSAMVESKHWTSYTKHILGQVLTIMEAAITDKDQIRAVKSLIEQTIWNNNEYLQKWMYDQQEGKGSTFPF